MDTQNRADDPQHDVRKHGHDGHHTHVVAVELNEPPPKLIPAGDYIGKTLKITLGVPVDHQLDQVIHGKFDEVKNDEPIKIKGGEKFVSHCGQGQSS